MPCMDAQRVPNGCPDTVAHSYISFGSHKASAHKRTSCSSYAAITDIISEFNALMYQLNEIKLMTVNLYSYSTDLWSNKTWYTAWTKPAISPKNCWVGMFHRRYKQRAVRLLYSFLCSFLLFPSSVFPPWFCSLKWCCYSRWLGAIWRTDKRNTSLKIWKYVCMRTSLWQPRSFKRP